MDVEILPDALEEVESTCRNLRDSDALRHTASACGSGGLVTQADRLARVLSARLNAP
jgi:hypothetical protein